MWGGMCRVLLIEIMNFVFGMLLKYDILNYFAFPSLEQKVQTHDA
jgi:hypothetical protein